MNISRVSKELHKLAEVKGRWKQRSFQLLFIVVEMTFEMKSEMNSEALNFIC